MVERVIGVIRTGLEAVMLETLVAIDRTSRLFFDGARMPIPGGS